MPKTIFTQRGIDKMRAAIGDQTAVVVTHIALGDGLGSGYEPAPERTRLRGERVRRPIETRLQTAAREWVVTASFPPRLTPVFEVREAGYFDAAGDLVALWAVQQTGLDADRPRQAGVIELVVDQVLSLDAAADGAIIVEAPDDGLALFALATVENQALQARELIRLDAAVQAINAGR